MSNNDFHVSVGQWSPVLGRVTPNLEQLGGQVEQAVAAEADLLVTPELGLTGYLLMDLVPALAMAADDPRLAPVAQWSRRVPIVAGFVERGPDGLCYNAAGYWDQGRLVHVHRKVYLPTYGLFQEGRFFARGDRVQTFHSRVGPLAMLICEDLWHPSAVTMAVRQGAVGLLISSAAPGRGIARGASELTSRGIWRDLIHLYTRLFGCWVAWSNRTGFEDGVLFSGGSLVHSPQAPVPLVEAGLLESGVWTARLKADAVPRARDFSGMLREEDPWRTQRMMAQWLEGRLPPGDFHD